MSKSTESYNFYWHRSAGACILLPSPLVVTQPFPEFYAKANRGVTSIIVLITLKNRAPAKLDVVFRHPPRSSPPRTEIKILRNCEINKPYFGKEFAWEECIAGNPVLFYGLERLVCLDDSSGVIASMSVRGQGTFCDVEPVLQEILNSFSWDPDSGPVLKFDGDEIVHRTRYRKKGNGRKGENLDSRSQLPVRLRYLQSVIDELQSLPSEEINEDLDVSHLDRVLRQRIRGLSLDKAEIRLEADRDALKKWIQQDSDKRTAAEFVLAFMHSFEFSMDNKDDMSQ